MIINNQTFRNEILDGYIEIKQLLYRNEPIKNAAKYIADNYAI